MGSNQIPALNWDAVSDGSWGVLGGKKRVLRVFKALSFCSGATRGSVCLSAPDRRAWMVPGDPGRPGESVAGHAVEVYRHPFASVTARGRWTCACLWQRGPALSWLHSIAVRVGGEGSSQVSVQLCARTPGGSWLRHANPISCFHST